MLPRLFFFQAEDGIRDRDVTGVQTCALPISLALAAGGMALVFGGEGERGIEAFRGALELAEDSEELRTDPRLLSFLVMGPLWLRESESGRALVETTVETARAQAALGVLPSLLDRVA